ncbi:MAG: hypothetical protein P1V97_29385, partial [Planctomycetota bacterium]|nr:hypothetical protein [Planctomycetota bacterium]
MITFVPLGLETLSPHRFLDASFMNMHSDMPVSHDVLPVLGWTLGFAGVVWALTRNSKAALWCGGLIAFHEILDLVVGFPHRLAGPETPEFGLALY